VLGLVHADLELALKIADTVDINSKDSEGNTVLSWAARRADESAVILLLENGAEHAHASVSGHTALHYAVGAKTPTCILPLLKAGAEVDYRNLWGETALHVAALRHDDPEGFMAPLLAYGADPNTVDHENSNVLSFAAQANHPRVVEYLIRRGVDIDIPDDGGLTSIGVAALYNHHEVLSVLLAAGADCTTSTSSQESILHIAAKNADLRTISILTGAHLNLAPDGLDSEGLTPEAYILRRDDAELTQAFKQLLSTLKCPSSAGAEMNEKDEKRGVGDETETEYDSFEDALEERDSYSDISEDGDMEQMAYDGGCSGLGKSNSNSSLPLCGCLI
jgi:ankyrin repeat protein